MSEIAVPVTGAELSFVPSGYPPSRGAARRYTLYVTVPGTGCHEIWTPSLPDAVVVTPEGGAGDVPGCGSSTIPVTGVAGSAPMSVRMFVVVCWIVRLGSPTPSPLFASPRFQ